MKRRTQEERGEGEGELYDPPLHVHEVPSMGRSHRVLGWWTNRVHHFLSDLEFNFFLVNEWLTEVADFREQYPLRPHEETIAIAESLGVRHPTHPKTKQPIEMTTDAILTIHRGAQVRYCARTLKYACDLASSRVLEKFEIEKLYWERRGYDWGIVTEKDVPIVLARNVEYVHACRSAKACAPLSATELQSLAAVLAPELEKQQASIRCVTQWADERLGHKPGVSLRAVRHLIANRKLPVDMFVKIDPSKPLTLIPTTPAVIHGKTYAPHTNPVDRVGA